MIYVMSEQEEHAIIGKTVAEYRQAKTRLASLEGKRVAYLSKLRAAISFLDPSTPGVQRYGGDFGGRWKDVVSELPSKDELVMLGDAITEALAEKQRLSKSLSDLGLNLKD